VVYKHFVPNGTKKQQAGYRRRDQGLKLAWYPLATGSVTFELIQMRAVTPFI